MSISDSTIQTIAWLVPDVARLLRRDFDRRVRSLGLTQAQWRAIAHLALNEGINQTELAERLEVKPITLARLIDRMQHAGWVERVADVNDRRVTRLFLTQSVQPMLKELQGHAESAVNDVLRKISKANRKILVQALQQMKVNLIEAQCANDSANEIRKDNDV
jgi:DNA-binding MarR family transcriptional regulator